MRFCFVTTFYPPYNFGGDGINVQRLARALVKRGHDVTVVFDRDAYNSLRKTGSAASERFDDGVKVAEIKSGFGILAPLLAQQTGYPLLSKHLLKPLLEKGFDVIHYHNVSLVGGPGILQYGNAVKLFTAHEHWLVCPAHTLWRHGKEVCTGRECVRCQLSYFRPPQIWRHTGLLEKELHHIDLFLALSEFSREKHREFGFPREMTVLPCFVPDTNLIEDENHQTTPHARPYFLFVGRLEIIKGLDDVIPLFRQYTGADLLIAGEGGHGEALRSLAAGLCRVRFLGQVSNHELHRYYRHAIATLAPSVCYETFGATIIESFQQSTPVIARRIGASTELLQASQGGLLFEKPAELVAALSKMQGEVEFRARAAHAARQAFLAQWSEDVVVPRYLELVMNAASRRARKADLG